MAMAEWWDSTKATISAYTGMTTPAAFFTVVAVFFTAIAASGLFARPAQVPRRRREEEAEERAFQPLPPPVQVQLGEVTEEELRAYDGFDPEKPLLMAIKGQIYDVTQSRMFYGPGGPYASFAGRDASRALAKMSFEPNDLTGDVSGLSPFEVEALEEWEYKFKSKYVTVGTIKKTVPLVVGDAHIAPRAVTSQRDISESTIDTDVHVTTIGHEDVETAKELTDLEVPSESIHTDAVEKPEETPNVAVRNNSLTEDAIDPKGTPQVVDAKNRVNLKMQQRSQRKAPAAGDMNKSEPEMKMLGNQTKHK